MNSIELQKFLTYDKTLSKFNMKVCAADQLPKVLSKYPTGFIVNTDPIAKHGSHWIAIFFYSVNYCEFFDSLGHPPAYYHKHFEKFIKSFANEYIYNRQKIQMMTSNVCGVYCLMFILYCCHGKRLCIFQRLFSKNKLHNDTFIMRMYKHYITRCLLKKY